MRQRLLANFHWRRHLLGAGTALMFVMLTISSHAQNSTGAYTDALVALKRGEFAEARTKALAAKAESNDSDPMPLFLLGRIALAQGDTKAATELIQEGVKIAPENPMGNLYLGQILFAQRDFRAAETALNQYVEARSGDKDARLLLLYCQVGRGNFPDAGSSLLKLDQFDDLHPGYYFGKAAIAQARATRDRDANQADKVARNEELVVTNLQSAQTMYGNETYGRYVRDYYMLFPPKKKGTGSGDIMDDLFPSAPDEM